MAGVVSHPCVDGLVGEVVQMRCGECAAEVAATAGVCSRCGGPIVGAAAVVADTVVADTVAGAVSDAALTMIMRSVWTARRASS